MRLSTERNGETMKRRTTFYLMALGLVTVLGALLRAVHLDHPMRYDESYNYLRYVIQGPAYIATNYLPNNHILHTLCVWGATKLAGDSPAALRIPALVAGVLLIPATACLAWTVSRRESAALLGALAVATSSALIEYSVNARGYSMLALWVVLATQCLMTAVREPSLRGRWLWWGAAGAAGMYTVPVMALPLVGMGVFVITAAILARDRASRSALLMGLAGGTGACVGLTFLAYLPVLLTGGIRPFAQSQQMAYDVLGQQITSVSNMLVTAGVLWVRHASPLMMVLMASAPLIFLMTAVRERDRLRWILPVLIGVSAFVAVVATAPLPARTWVFALPLLLVMVACGLSDLASRESAAGRWGGRAVQGAGILLMLLMGVRVAESETLVSEPGGLVLVEPALEACRDFGAEKCAVVAPFTPATGYYQSQLGLSRLAHPGSIEAERVVIVTDGRQSLDDVWRPGVAGYENFGVPQRIWQRESGSLYVAERVERNVLR